MSVKIRISSTEDEELAGVIRLLSPALKSHKVSGKKEGKYRNAYADLYPGFQNDEPGEDAERGCTGVPEMLRNAKIYCSTYVGK